MINKIFLFIKNIIKTNIHNGLYIIIIPFLFYLLLLVDSCSRILDINSLKNQKNIICKDKPQQTAKLNVVKSKEQ